MKLALDPERVWLMGCSRCSNEGVAYSERKADAVAELLKMGWTRESYRNYCPACNGEVRS